MDCSLLPLGGTGAYYRYILRTLPKFRNYSIGYIVLIQNTIFERIITDSNIFAISVLLYQQEKRKTMFL